MKKSPAKEYLKNKNDNIITFKEETDKDTDYQAYNRSLSGWYVVTDMKIIYNTVKDFKGLRIPRSQPIGSGHLRHRPDSKKSAQRRNIIPLHQAGRGYEALPCGCGRSLGGTRSDRCPH